MPEFRRMIAGMWFNAFAIAASVKCRSHSWHLGFETDTRRGIGHSSLLSSTICRIRRLAPTVSLRFARSKNLSLCETGACFLRPVAIAIGLSSDFKCLSLSPNISFSLAFDFVACDLPRSRTTSGAAKIFRAHDYRRSRNKLAGRSL